MAKHAQYCINTLVLRGKNRVVPRAGRVVPRFLNIRRISLASCCLILFCSYFSGVQRWLDLGQVSRTQPEEKGKRACPGLLPLPLPLLALRDVTVVRRFVWGRPASHPEEKG